MTAPSERRAAATSRCEVVELRRYTLHPGARETLTTLFDREFVETQEAVGMQVIAQFRDIDHPDVFTWLRGFPDMTTRAAALGAFYDGPVWRAHRGAANATMIDSDDVRLLRPARQGSGFACDDVDRPGPEARDIPLGLYVATIYALRAPAAEGFIDCFEDSIAPELRANGAHPMATFQTEYSSNNYPRLPVREGEHAFVWFARFASVAAYDRHVASLEHAERWRAIARPVLERYLAVPQERWRLMPTARSRPLKSDLAPDRGTVISRFDQVPVEKSPSASGKAMPSRSNS